MSQRSQKSQKSQGDLGNTRSKSRSRKWCFTLNNYSEEEVKKLSQDLSDYKYVIGREVGESGTPHLQGYVEHKNQITFSKMKKLMPRAHIEKARGNGKQNYTYCSKEGNFITNMDFRTHREKLADECLTEYNDVKWLPWQQEILDLKNDKRTIHWYWEAEGNVGKSFLCKYLAITRKVIICEGKKADIFNQVNTMIEAKTTPKLIICDIPRTAIDYINYGALEQLKNGMLYSGKYEGGVCIFPSPLVICLANMPPDRSKMSADRWHIVDISDSVSVDDDGGFYLN